MLEDTATKKLAKTLVQPSHIDCALNAFSSVQSSLRSILAQRALPEEGLPDAHISFYMSYLALLDSNNFAQHAGAGEREGRTWSSLVRNRHYAMSHGIGRSGDLTADQPKAAGSTLLYKITNIIVTDLLRTVCALKSVAKAIVVPMATGMTLSLVFSALRTRLLRVPCTDNSLSERERGRYIIWCRIDQKTCFKCIFYSGCEPHVVSLNTVWIQSGDEQKPRPEFFQSRAASVRKAIESFPSRESILCVLTTTSCFAPRLPDPILDIARVCAELNVSHVVNHAYGLQSAVLCKRLESAMQCGRVDAFVSSTDKNFLVPVGGAVVASPKGEILDHISEAYPGRANASPIIDVFLTLLGLGRSGYRTLCKERTANMILFVKRLREVAATLGEDVYEHPENDISVVMTLCKLPNNVARRELGSRLYHHCISGPRVVVVDGKETNLMGSCFRNYGAHHDAVMDCEHEALPLGVTAEQTPTYPSYLAAACGIGVTSDEIETFCQRLFKEYHHQRSKDVSSS